MLANPVRGIWTLTEFGQFCDKDDLPNIWQRGASHSKHLQEAAKSAVTEQSDDEGQEVIG